MAPDPDVRTGLAQRRRILTEIPGPRSRALAERRARVVAAGVSSTFPVYVARASGAVLEAKPVLYLGKISYGIYVYHLLVPAVAGPLLHAVGVRVPSKSIGEFVIYSLVTIGVASISWRFFERPINGLKRRFAAVGRGAPRPLVG